VKELLEGRRLGFALRPVLASIALGLALGVTGMDLVAWFAWGTRETNGLVVASFGLAAVATVVGILSTLSAVAEMSDVPEDDRTLARLDVAAAAVATALYAATALLRWFDQGAPAATPPAFLLAVAALIVLVAGVGTSALLYAPREWEEIEDVAPERHGRRAAAR